jgi:DNA-binding NarL/FixJ family response regulator
VLAVTPQALTAREQEVAGLAARGWTTAQIAEALVVSIRTVDNHLHRAYGKLGITSRHELGRLMPAAATRRPAGR